ncbi:MAG TPA: NAD(P)-dependent oxidoreductase [Chloroflexota bacterium]
MTILITGGGGFIATRLATLLAADGEQVVLLDRAFPESYRRLAPAGVERRSGDITGRADLWRTIEDVRPSGIVHLAAVLSGQSEGDPALAFDVNVLGTFNVLEGARRHGVGKVVATSSIAAIERAEPADPVDERSETSPLGVYGMSKISMEGWCAFYRRRFGLDARVGRPGAVVGPGREAGGASSNFTTAIISEPLAGRPYVCPVAEEDAAPLVYHTDLVRGVYLLYRAEKVSSPVYNLGACSATAGQLAELVRARVPGASISFRPDEVARFVVGRWRHVVQDNRLAARDLGYVPEQDTPARLVDAFVRESAPELAAR